MLEWFNKQSNIVRGILLIIPFVGWVFELVIRWSAYSKNNSTNNLLMGILVIFFGGLIGLIDGILTLIGNNMLLM